MKNALSVLFQLAVIVMLVFSGCYKVERSDPMVEDGVVVQTEFRPYHQHHYTTTTTSVDAQGRVSISTEPCTDTYYEQYWVVFACQHGQFAIERESIWRKVSPGLKVKIRYRQLDKYREKDGTRTHMGTDFEFEDCWPAEGEWGGVK